MQKIEFRGIWNKEKKLVLDLDSQMTIDTIFRYNKTFKDWCLKEYLPRERLSFYYWPHNEPIENCIRLIRNGHPISSNTRIIELDNNPIIHVIGRRINVLSDEELKSIIDNQDQTRLPIINGDPNLYKREITNNCIVCCEREADICIKQCGHMLMCIYCTEKNNKCLVCGVEYVLEIDVMRVYG